MDWKSIGEKAIGGAAQGAAGSAIGSLFGLAAQRMNFNYQKKLMNEQWKYQQMAFDLENDRQDYLLANSNLIAKQALKKAGYSTADPNGTGVTAPATSTLDAPSQPGSQIDIAQHALQGAQVVSNINLANAQSRNLEANARKTEAETDYQEMYNEIFRIYGKDNYEAATKGLQEEVKLRIAETLKTDQDRLNSVQLTEAQIKDINQRLDMDWIKLEPQVQLICAQAFEAEARGELSKAEIDKVWQDIKESQQRIVNLKKDLQLTDAQIAVCGAQVTNYAADTDLKNASKGKVKSERNAQNIENEYNRLMLDLKKSLGDSYNRAEMVYKALMPLAGSVSILNRGK